MSFITAIHFVEWVAFFVSGSYTAAVFCSLFTMPVLPFTPFGSALVVTAAAGVVALLIAGVFRLRIAAAEVGNDKMQSIARLIRQGAMAFLVREYTVIVLFSAVVGVLLYAFLDVGWTNMMNEQFVAPPYTTMSFALGALCSLAAGFIGMRSATTANVRTAQAARKSLAAALKISFLSGATMGLAVVGLAILGLTGMLFYLVEMQHVEMKEALNIITGFSFGASSVALFARVGGGIYTKAADVGADLVGKVEAGIPEDDPRNPAVIADNVGDNVGDVAGMGADLFESYIGAIIAAMLIGYAGEVGYLDPSAIGLSFLADALVGTQPELDTMKLVVLPLYLSAFGIIASILATLVVRLRSSSDHDVQRALKNGLFGSSALVVIGTYFITNYLLPQNLALGVFFASSCGLIAGVLIGMLTEYYTSQIYAPVKELAEATKTGAATTLISGLALGYASTFLPVMVVCVAIGLSFIGAGMYGIAISAVGMLSTLAMSLAIDAFGPVADNAGGIAEMAKLPPQVRARTDVLDSAGNTTAAIGKGFAIGVAGFMCLALFAAFKTEAGLVSIDASKPQTMIGILIGGMLPFLFSSLTMRAVGRAAMDMVHEVRRQFKEIKGLMQGKAEGDAARCVAISTNAAIREMMLPGLIAICSPVLTGLILGTEALGGLLVGALVTSIMLGTSMANSGGAWDNAKKYIEAGHLGGKGSDAHKAAVVGDTVGDPFKDTSGPSLNILVKLMSIVSLVTVGLYGQGLFY